MEEKKGIIVYTCSLVPRYNAWDLIIADDSPVYN